MRHNVTLWNLFIFFCLIFVARTFEGSLISSTLVAAVHFVILYPANFVIRKYTKNKYYLFLSMTAILLVFYFSIIGISGAIDLKWGNYYLLIDSSVTLFGYAFYISTSLLFSSVAMFLKTRKGD